MDKQRIGLIGAIVIVCLTIGAATLFGLKQIAIPQWLTVLLGVVTTALGAFFGWIAKSPVDQKADAPKDAP